MTTSRSTDAIPATSDERRGGNCEYNNQKDDDNYGDNGGGGEEEAVAARSYTTIKYDDDNYGDRGRRRGGWLDDGCGVVCRILPHPPPRQSNTQTNHVPFDPQYYRM